ncbi:MAG: phage tail tape measure protein [Prolixibacteraceae bacterium]|nr:phage tail tape measure protein [Prolixibacteraceae bacterium]
MGIGLGNNLGLGIAYSLKDMFTQNAVKISHAMNGLEKKTDDLAAKIEKTQQRMYGGMKMMAAGGAVVAAFVPAISASMEFGRAMGEVSTLVDSNTVSMDTLGNSLLNLSTKYGQMPVEQTKALYNVISTGYTEIADANRILEASNKAAIAGVTDVNTAFEASVAIMKPYGMGVEQINSAYDKLFQTVNLGITKMPELSASMSQVTPIAQAVGISIDELLASISSMTVTTKASTSEVATQMSALSSGILEGAGKQALIKKKYGLEIDMSSVALKNKGLLNFLGDITKQLNTLDATTRDMALSDIFGRREAILAYMTLTGAGAKAFSEHLDKIKNSAGATEAAFQKMSETVGFQFDRMKASAMAMLIRIGQAVEPLVASILSVFTRLTSAISTFMQSFPFLTSFIGQTVLAFGGIIMAGGLLLTGLASLVIMAPMVSAGLLSMGITAEVATGGLIAMGTAAQASLAPIWAALSPILAMLWSIMWPILAITAGIILLKVAWDRNFFGMRTSVLRVIEPVKLAISTIYTAWKSLKNGIVQIDDETANKLKASGMFGFVKNTLMFLYRAKNLVSGFFYGIKNAFVPVFTELKISLKSLWGSLKPLWDGIIKIVEVLTGSSLAGSPKTFHNIGQAAGKLLTLILNPLIMSLKAIASLIRWVSYAVDFLSGSIEEFFYIFVEGFRLGVGGTIDWVQEKFENMFTWVFNKIDWVSKKLDGILGWLLGDSEKNLNLNVSKGMQKIGQGVGLQRALSSMSSPGFIPAYSSPGNPMAYINQNRQVSPMLPTAVVAQKELIWETTRQTTNNTIEREKAGKSVQPQSQTIKLEVDGRTLAQVVNDTNKREAVRRL